MSNNKEDGEPSPPEAAPAPEPCPSTKKKKRRKFDTDEAELAELGELPGETTTEPY